MLRLTDGRRLGYAEYGDAAGVPLLVFHGVPGSRLSVRAAWLDAPAPGVRVIAPDRPGMGLSDRQAGRRLLDWPADIRQLADALGLARFLVAGISGGGPYALAAAHALPERVAAVASVCGPAQIRAVADLAGMRMANKIVFIAGRTAPTVLRLAGPPCELAARRWPQRMATAGIRALAAADRQIAASQPMRRILVETSAEAFRQGSGGVVDDIAILAKPWGFDPGQITVEVFAWHGQMDRSVPFTSAQRLAASIPGCVLTAVPDGGHLIYTPLWPHITRTLLTAWHNSQQHAGSS